ncbi:MAG: amidohydrolase family protein [Deltaproteobacteria bacterium]|nr:amidohydrolase family protein [Deltaproteobacteria bacterium]
MRKSFKFDYYLKWMGTSLEELEEKGDAYVIERIAEQIRDSKSIDQVVLLAMDGFIGSDGKLDQERTQIYVPNEYLAEHAEKYDEILWGASINPKRSDALERLRWSEAHGAVLVKWLPPIMGIDPSDKALRPFYEELIRLDLPLLVHTGKEHAFAHADHKLADPARLEFPLELGVTVIAAHAATKGSSEGEENFERLMRLMAKYPKLYADISSLTQINKWMHLEKVMARPETQGRLAYGSDWPLQFFPVVSSWFYATEIGAGRAMEIDAIENPWDRDIALKQALGVSDGIFNRSRELLGKRVDSLPSVSVSDTEMNDR